MLVVISKAGIYVTTVRSGNIARQLLVRAEVINCADANARQRTPNIIVVDCSAPDNNRARIDHSRTIDEIGSLYDVHVSVSIVIEHQIKACIHTEMSNLVKRQMIDGDVL